MDINNLRIKNSMQGSIILPLQIEFKPKEDITTYELAKIIPFFISPVMPYDIDYNESYVRHLIIEDPNKET